MYDVHYRRPLKMLSTSCAVCDRELAVRSWLLSAFAAPD
ncbi:hypothetical protein F443_22654 [Phytophthora nicotianae P1569]|uniref:Uncharacterized protein n=1 Tax=Phytophthora nicotianae P1569 TaxID=1317065 RepID=V9DW33_PHYNI|nr:hypothetical protein F443_22654 [Phytophthora nicotianae P1569]